MIQGCVMKDALTQMWRRVLILPWRQDLINRTLANVHEHVRVREALHRAHLVSLHGWYEAIEGLAAVVLFQNLTVGHGSHAIVVELEPPCLAIGLDQSEIVATVEVSRVDEDTMELVNPRC